MQHPLPDLSGQDAATIAGRLADERAKLEEQLARGAPDQPARASQLPSSVPQAFLPAQRRAVSEARRRPGAPPWKGPAAQPSWRVLGTMVGRPGGEGGAPSLMSLAGRLSAGTAAEAEAKPDVTGTDVVQPGTERDLSRTDLVPSEPAPPDVAPADAALPAEAVPAADTANATEVPPADATALPADAVRPAEASAAAPDPAIAAVRDTFAIVGAAGDEAAGYFYGRLFAGHPELRELFPAAMNEQRDRLFRAFGRIVGSLSSPEEMAAYLAQLGKDHRKYSVEPEMYDAVGDALMAALRAYAGPAFTPAAEEAWAQAYKAVSSLMIAAADKNSLTAPPFWAAEVVDNEKRRPGISILTVATYLPLPYEPGQHITVQTPRSPKVWRPYSVACRPREDGLMTFHVKAVPGGWVSNALVYHSEPGTELVLGPALGTMTLGLQLTPVTSDDPAFDGMQGNVGRVAARYLPHRECEAYVAGPPEMVRETVRVLARSGLPRDRIHYDNALLAGGEQPS